MPKRWVLFEKVYYPLGMSRIESIADLQCDSRSHTLCAQSRAREVRRHTEKKDMAIRAGREDTRHFNAWPIDARNCEIGRCPDP